jgi:hypothetical protein
LEQIGLHALASGVDDFLARATKQRWSPRQILEHLVQTAGLGKTMIAQWFAFGFDNLDLRKSRLYPGSVVKPGTVRTSLDIPAPLHRKLHEAAMRRGCSARQLILWSIERLVEEEAPHSVKRARLPLVPAAGRQIRPVTNDEALFP